VTVDGITGTRVSFEVADGYQYRYCAKACVLLYVDAAHQPLSFDVGDRVQMDVLAVGGRTLLAIHSGDPDEGVVDTVLASLHFS
jgi:hypothetical protein